MKMYCFLVTICAVAASYFAGFEVQRRVEQHIFKQRGYEIVTVIKAPDEVQKAYTQQAQSQVSQGLIKAVESKIKTHMPQIAGIN